MTYRAWYKNPNDRLLIRIKMYEILGKSELNFGPAIPKRDEFLLLFRKALLLKDEQLLSELYSLYAERNQGSIIDRLFYLNKSIEIQTKLGIEHFPRIYLRHFPIHLEKNKANSLFFNALTNETFL